MSIRCRVPPFPSSLTRLAIPQYAAQNDASLMDLLDDETSGFFFSGDFNLVIKKLLARSETVEDDAAEADDAAAAEQAAALYAAMKGVGTDEQAVVETLCSVSRAQIAAIRVAFENEYGKSLESWLECVGRARWRCSSSSSPPPPPPSSPSLLLFLFRLCLRLRIHFRLRLRLRLRPLLLSGAGVMSPMWYHPPGRP